MRKRTTRERPANDGEGGGSNWEGKGRREDGRGRSEVITRVNLPSYALQPRNDTAVGAHCGRVDQVPEMDPRRRSRLVERTAVGEGG
jgi:hypothetical protein